MAFWKPRRAEPAPRPDPALVAKALVALEAATVALRRTNLKRTFRAGALGHQLLTRRRRAPRDARVVIAAVARAAFRSPRRYECLQKSLALWWLLRREGHDARVKLGVSPLDDRLDAHAWVELDGEVVLDDDGAVAEFWDFGLDMAEAFRGRG